MSVPLHHRRGWLRGQYSIVGRIMIAASLLTSTQLSGQSDTQVIAGWPMLPDVRHREQGAARDPVFDRLTCPAFSRIHFGKGADSLVFSRVQRSDSTWRYRIRDGLYWWSGQPVVAGDAERFVTEQLQALARRPSFVWDVPKHKVSTDGHEVVVDWQIPPKFGPFVFHDEPFSRPADKSGPVPYECIGIYKIDSLDGDIVLKRNTGYPASWHRSKTLVFTQSLPKAGEGLYFEMASSLPDRRLPGGSVRFDCDTPVQLPVFTALIWNLASPKVKALKASRSTEALLPRQALVDGIAGGWGIPTKVLLGRAHPAWQPVEGKTDFARFDQPKNLNVYSDFPQDHILLSSIVNYLKLINIDLTLVKSPSEADLSVVGIETPWPTGDLTEFLHSNGRNRAHLDKYTAIGKTLDPLLESFRQSLTFGEVNVSKLQEIHANISQLGFLTVAFQHRACLRGVGSLTAVNESDPDWFKRLLAKVK